MSLEIKEMKKEIDIKEIEKDLGKITVANLFLPSGKLMHCPECPFCKSHLKIIPQILNFCEHLINSLI